ncbi:MAG: hypothetical protein LIO53_03295 [Oscillospiraceae bacterium]|nr:hypothetical protein [Oscillospiraceae bacterium]
MDCEKFNECLDNYENLSEENRMMMAVHAAECESCKRELEFMLSIMETVKTLPKIETPPDFMDNLNLRIDAEEREKRRIAKRVFLNVRRNWKQYATAAACFALVAVLTANGKDLIGNMYGNDDGVIQETAVTENSDAQQSQSDEILNESEPAGTEETVIADAEITETEENYTVSSDISPTKTTVLASVSQTNNTAGEAAAAVTAEPVAESAEMPVSADTDTSDGTDVIVETEANNAAEEQTAAVTESSDGYALQTYEAANESGYAAVETTSRPQGEYAPPNGESNAQTDYSLAEVGSIARGRSYDEERNREKAIGNLKISESDAEKAMDVILLYSYALDDVYYSTNADSLSMMLSKLSQKGVGYKNYIPSYDGDITFKLVIQ